MASFPLGQAPGRPKYVVEEHRHNDIAQACDKSQRDTKPAANEKGGCSGQEREQIKGAGNPAIRRGEASTIMVCHFWSTGDPALLF